MKRLFLWSALLLVALFHSSAARCQQLTVQNEAGKQVVLSRAEIEALPHVTVTATEHSGTAVKFEGVSLKERPRKAGVNFGESLKGKRLASYLLVEAGDGYRVIIALPELDPGFMDKTVMLAFLRDGKPLAEKEGPYRIVIPDEKRMARWVRQVVALKIVDAQ